MLKLVAGGSGRSRARAGFSLIEIAVAVAILVVLAATITPTVVRRLDRERVEIAVTELEKIAAGISLGRTDNNDYPHRLRHLSSPITTSDTNICGTTYTAGKIGNWDGPYYDRVIPSSGLPIGIGVVDDSIIRDPDTGTFGDMIIVVNGVSEEDAEELNRLMDNDGSATGGAVRWTTTDAASGTVQLTFRRPIKQC